MGNSGSLVHDMDQLLHREARESKHRHARRSVLNRLLLQQQEADDRAHSARSPRRVRRGGTDDAALDAEAAECFRRLGGGEMRRLRRVFRDCCGSEARLGEAEFGRALAALDGEIGRAALPARLFAALDRDGRGLSFAQFAAGMAVLLDGTPEEKLDLAFREMTVEGGGATLKPGELFQVLRDALINAVHMNLALSHEEMAPEQVVALERQLSARVREFVADAFVEIDTRGDHVISYDEFRVWVTEHPQFLALLLAFHSKDLRKNLDEILDATAIETK